MTEQASTVYTKEYLTNSGLLIIANIFSSNIPKTKIIIDIIENTAYSDSEYFVQSACRNTADYGSQAKEETN